jgi:hypothetical protein
MVRLSAAGKIVHSANVLEISDRFPFFLFSGFHPVALHLMTGTRFFLLISFLHGYMPLICCQSSDGPQKPHSSILDRGKDHLFLQGNTQIRFFVFFARESLEDPGKHLLHDFT